MIPVWLVDKGGRVSYQIVHVDHPAEVGPFARKRVDGEPATFWIRKVGDWTVFVQEGADWTLEGLRLLISKARS